MSYDSRTHYRLPPPLYTRYERAAILALTFGQMQFTPDVGWQSVEGVVVDGISCWPSFTIIRRVAQKQLCSLTNPSPKGTRLATITNAGRDVAERIEQYGEAA